jgi:serine/threonine protein kinase/Tol biopolymer transport system component
MGEVYRALDTRLDRIVALKILPHGFASDKSRMRRFVRESKAASAFNHPNICTIYDIGESEGINFIAFEYVAGQTLAARIYGSTGSSEEVGQPIATAEILEIGLQVADALDTVSQKGIVHRDIKPGNLMLTPKGQVKVLDFGLAKIVKPGEETTNGDTVTVSSTTVAPVVLGTVAYMSPEQLQGLDLDPRADIFSLGVVFYEMATGRRPFLAKTLNDTVNRILHEQPEAVAHFNESVPSELEQIIRKCLEKDRDRRYQSARELLVDLQNLKRATASIIADEPAEKTQRAIASNRWRRRWWPSLAGAVLLFCGAVAFWPRAAEIKVSGYAQLTNDGYPKFPRSRLVTDGSRLYFSERINGTYILSQVSSTGGETIPFVSPVLRPGILDISPNRSELLVYSSTATGTEYPLWVLPLVGGSPRRLGEINALDAAWSPDGKRIAYTRGTELFVAKSDGTESRLLVQLAGRPTWPRWSPDGKRLRFTLLDTHTQLSSLWETSTDGRKPLPLLPGWNSPPMECCGSWTKDGIYYIFQATRDEGTHLWALREKKLFLDAASPVQLTQGPMSFLGPSPSQDRKLFALGMLKRGELVRYEAAKQEFVRFLSGISASVADFSRDGQWIAYSTFPEGNLWRSRLDGSDRLQLTFPPMSVSVPCWSPDGKEIAFSASETASRFRKIYVVPANGGSVRALIADGQNEYDPSWSPEGSKIVFGMGHRDTRTRVLGVLDLKTRQVSTVPGSEAMYAPRWAPDGRNIVAVSSDEQQLLLFNTKTQTWQQLIRDDTVTHPRWSRDGEFVYFLRETSNDLALVRVRIDDKIPRHVVSLRGFLTHLPMSLAPDDSPVFTRNTSTEEIYALDLDGL